MPDQFAEAFVREALGLQFDQLMRRVRQAARLDLALGADNVFDLAQEPGIERGYDLHIFHAEAHPERFRDHADTVRGLNTQRLAQRILVLEGHLVEARQAGFQRAQRLLQAFLEAAANGHRLAHGFHRRRQHGLCALVFLEGEARDLGDDIVDRRLERGGRHAGDVIVQFVQRVPDGKLGGDLGNREAGRLRGQRRRPRHARVHLDHDETAIYRVHRELHVRPAGLHADLAQHRNRGVAHHLILFVGQREGRRHGDRVAGMHAHRINVLDRADDDAIVRLVADDFHLVFLPAEQALVDEDLRCRRGGEARPADVFVFLHVVGNAAACAAEREGRADDGGQADHVDGVHRRLEAGDPVIAFRLARLGGQLRRGDDRCSRVLEADPVHRFAEQLAVFSHFDGFGLGADQLDAVFLEDARMMQVQRAIQRRLAAHGGQERVRPLDGDDFLDDLRQDRLNIGRVRQLRIGHDRRRVGVDEDHPVALGFQRLDGLNAGIIELAGLADDDRAGADHKDRGDICALRHGGLSSGWAGKRLAYSGESGRRASTAVFRNAWKATANPVASYGAFFSLAQGFQ